MVSSRNSGEQLVGQVVVAVDVARGRPHGVVQLVRAAGDARRSRRSRCSRGGTSVGQPAGQDGEHAGQVVGVPVAGHVGLAEADQPVGPDPAEERVGSHQVIRRGRRRARHRRRRRRAARPGSGSRRTARRRAAARATAARAAGRARVDVGPAVGVDDDVGRRASGHAAPVRSGTAVCRPREEQARCPWRRIPAHARRGAQRVPGSASAQSPRRRAAAAGHRPRRTAAARRGAG